MAGASSSAAIGPARPSPTRGAGGTPGSHARPGRHARGRNAGPLPRAGPYHHVRLPPVGRSRRAKAPGHQYRRGDGSYPPVLHRDTRRRDGARPPKSRAGRRTVAVPPVILSAIRSTSPPTLGKAQPRWSFTTPAGRPIWRGNLNQLLDWAAATNKIEKPGLHFHDLRHTGNTLAAQTGASTNDPDGAHGPRLTPSRDDLPARHLRG